MHYFSPKLHQKICEKIISGASYEEIFSEYSIQACDRENFVDCINFILKKNKENLQKISYDYCKKKTNKKYIDIKNPLTKLISYNVIFSVIIFSIVLCVGFYMHSLGGCDGKYPLFNSILSILTVFGVVSGWTVSAWVAQRNLRVQQTLTLLGGRFSNAEYSKHAQNIKECFKGKKITPKYYEALEKSKIEKNKEIIKSSTYILNYFEFIASGAMSGELEIEIIKNILRGSMLYCFNLFEDVIYVKRTNGQPTLWINYTNFVEIIK
ncbi:hypothetical protein K6W36_15570 [Acetobacter senegalensis]|uniref:DUF4760 domain-containing protein n=1 Tax=Acetobacter senegalensis TaxID=446692 RepID=UPI001EDC3F6F|nr:hypothetical protein [Acetobacter senegalensis]MCG4261975.1 hypothetical protein [Acetobacter senegalensis]